MNNIKIKQRDLTIDFLRCVGLLLIVLAHVDPPNFIFQMRTCDVPIMVFVSGMAFSLSTHDIDSISKYKVYIWKRFKRLIIPTWIFLTAYFIFFGILKCFFVRNADISFTIPLIIRSYSLIDGVGYVWVIRVYFLMALIAPMIKKLVKLNIKTQLIVVICAGIINEILSQYLEQMDGGIFFVLKYTLLYILGYGIIYYFGNVCQKMSNIKLSYITILFLAVFVVILLVTHQPSIQAAKYPPKMYYISYGMIASLILLMMARMEKLKLIRESKLVSLISKYSLELYFWHTIPIQLVKYHVIELLLDCFITRYCFAIIIAAIGTFFQVKIRNKVNGK